MLTHILSTSLVNETTLWHKCYIVFTVIFSPAGQQCNWFLPNQLSSSLLWSKTFFFSHWNFLNLQYSTTQRLRKKKKNLFLFVSFFFFLFYNLFFPTPPTYASSIDIPHMYVFPPDQCANCGSLGLYNLLLALPILTMASNSILDLQCPSWPVLLSVALLLPLDPWSLVVVSPRPSLPTS